MRLSADVVRSHCWDMIGRFQLRLVDADHFFVYLTKRVQARRTKASIVLWLFSIAHFALTKPKSYGSALTLGCSPPLRTYPRAFGHGILARVQENLTAS